MDRYQLALGHNLPQDIKLSAEDLNAMVKPSEITSIYDNLYAKPALGGQHQKFSMSVLFSVDRIIYYGQFCYETSIWDTSPGDDKCRTFFDRDVEYWFYPPGAREIFEKYRDDVLSGACSDTVSRLEEYSPFPVPLGKLTEEGTKNL